MRKLICFLSMFIVIITVNAKDYQLKSPNQKISITVHTNGEIKFLVEHEQNLLVAPTVIAMELERGLSLGVNPVVIKKYTNSVSREIRPEVREKNEIIIENYNEIRLSFKQKFDLVFRAYDNGIAYRFETRFPNEITIKKEIGEYQFPDNKLVYWPKEKSFHSNNQVYYDFTSLGELSSNDLGSLPVLMTSEMHQAF